MVDSQAPAPPAGLSRRGLEARIIAKAWRDPLYAQLLAKDPKAVLQHEVAAVDPSIVLPDTLNVHVHQETPSDFHLVVPRNPRDVSLGEVLDDRFDPIAAQTVAVVVSAVNAVNTSAVSAAQIVGAVVNTTIYSTVNASMANLVMDAATVTMVGTTSMAIVANVVQILIV